MVDFTEILLIAIVALLLFGPDKLPQYLKELGKFYGEFRKMQREIENEINKEALLSGPSPRMPSEKVRGIAQKMGIGVDGKTEEQLLAEIDAAIVAGKAGSQGPGN